MKLLQVSRKDIPKAVITVLTVSLFWFYIIPHIRYSFTNSAGAHWFWVKDRCSYTRWELVEVRINPNDPFVPDPQHTLLIKHIACLPGETITKRGLSYYCNGHVFLGTAKLRAKDGRKLTPWTPAVKVIPEGYFFLSNPMCRDSYDSRYLGLFPKKAIVHCLRPLF